MFDLLPFGHRHGMQEVLKDMDDLVRKARGKWPFSELGSDFGGDWAPRLDMSENENEIIVKADLPGLETKDIDVSVDHELLVVKGERSQEKEKKEKYAHKIERQYGSFYRAVRLPCEVDEQKITANFKKGVLTLVMPKAEEAKRKATKIKISG